MSIQEVLVAQGLAEDTADETEMRQVIGVYAGHGVGLVRRPISGSCKEGVVLGKGNEGGTERVKEEGVMNGLVLSPV